MNELKHIVAQAKKALDKIENGKTFSTGYVLNRMENAASNNTRDALICHARDVVASKAKSQAFITQREISNVYDELYGLGGGRSNFRKELGDLLLDKHAVLKESSKGADSARIPYENKLSPLFEENELSKELAGVFSLDKQASFSAFSNNSVKKAEKFARLQLVSMGCVPQEVKAVKTNDHFILCNASVDTSDFTQVNIPIPVRVTNGIPSLPTHFVQEDSLVKLNKANLYVFVKDKNNFIKKTAASRFAAQRSVSDFQVDTPVVPASLEKYADLENELVASMASFSRDQIRVASGVVTAELAGLGVPNPQVRVSGSTDKILTFAADIPTPRGRVEIDIPVDMPNGRPVIPNNFLANGKSHKLNQEGLRVVLKASEHIDDLNKVSREVVEMSRLSYGQLIDRMIDGVSKNNYRQAEDALGVISEKFEGSQYLAALDKFTKLLKHSSSNTEREEMIKAALESGDLIRVPTSVQPYCPKLGLPVSKVDFDAKGRPVPMRRSAQQESIDELGAMMSTSRVTFS
jgi:hypothetical protein